ncbi:MAG: trimeric intracellular cation channel family protein [Hamadaea sp.]|nr:trimeric intracellular cation channel family protein [Hamadaea sp.]
MDSSEALLIADLTGVAVFAVSGASAGVYKHLDAFGVVFVGFVAALGGGIFRDLAIDTVPPLAFADWRYSVTAVVASLATFWLHPHLGKIVRTILTLDAAGLALFTVTGTLKALNDPTPVPAVGACFIGMLTGIGGGLMRDLLTGEIPLVLRKEIYAVASLAGAAVVATLNWLHDDKVIPLFLAGLLVFVIRMIAVKRQWSAPTARPVVAGPTGWPSTPLRRRRFGAWPSDRRAAQGGWPTRQGWPGEPDQPGDTRGWPETGSPDWGSESDSEPGQGPDAPTR